MKLKRNESNENNDVKLISFLCVHNKYMCESQHFRIHVGYYMKWTSGSTIKNNRFWRYWNEIKIKQIHNESPFNWYCTAIEFFCSENCCFFPNAIHLIILIAINFQTEFRHCKQFNYTGNQFQCVRAACGFFYFLLQMDKTNVQRKNIINCSSSLYKNVYWFWICVFMMCIVIFMIFNGVCFYLITFNAAWCACECIFIAVNHIKK